MRVVAIEKILESPAITIGEAGIAAAAVQELVAGVNGRELAAETLRQLASGNGHATVVALLESLP